MGRKTRFVPTITGGLFLLILCSGYESKSQRTQHDTMVAMDDGVELNTTVLVPPAPTPPSRWPAVVFVHGWGASKNLHLENCELYTRDGYVTMTYTVRAQGNQPGGAPSGGVSTMMGPREEQDFLAMISWLKQNYPVDPDRVGVTGRSQGGIHSWLATRPGSGLAVSVPSNFPASSTDAMLRNGSINPRFIDTTQTAFVDSELRDRARSALRQYDSDGIRDLMSVHGEYRPIVSEVRIPVMIQAAWEDHWGPSNSLLADFPNLKGPKKLYLGTGGHGSAVVEKEIKFRDEWRRRWFARWLKGEENGIDQEPPVEVSLLDTWEHIRLPSFPPPDAETRTLFLGKHAEQAAPLLVVAPKSQSNRVLQHRFDPEFSLEDFTSAGFQWNKPGPLLKEFTLASADYATSSLEQDWLVLGIPRVRLFVRGTASHFQVNLRLWDVDESAGTRRLFSRATRMVDASTHPDGAPIEVDMMAIGYRVLAGHRIALEISNLDLDWDKDRNDWWRVRAVPYFEAGEIEIYTGGDYPSAVEIPVS